MKKEKMLLTYLKQEVQAGLLSVIQLLVFDRFAHSSEFREG